MRARAIDKQVCRDAFDAQSRRAYQQEPEASARLVAPDAAADAANAIHSGKSEARQIGGGGAGASFDELARKCSATVTVGRSGASLGLITLREARARARVLSDFACLALFGARRTPDKFHSP